jgi:hypothetical protein
MRFKNIVFWIPVVFLGVGIVLIFMHKSPTLPVTASSDADSVWVHYDEIPVEAVRLNNGQYWVDTSHVYIKRVDEQHIVQGADPATLYVFPELDEYAKDASHVYYAGLVLVDADPKTFSVLPSMTYGKDADRVYWRWIPINGADVNSFKTFNDKVGSDGSYEYTAQDKNHKYLWEKVVQ